MSEAVTRRDMVRSIAGKTGLNQTHVRNVVQNLFDGIMHTLASGKRVELRGFGVFEACRRRARKARNPRTGQAVDVPQRTVPHFKPGKLLKETIAKRRQANP